MRHRPGRTSTQLPFKYVELLKIFWTYFWILENYVLLGLHFQNLYFWKVIFLKFGMLVCILENFWLFMPHFPKFKNFWGWVHPFWQTIILLWSSFCGPFDPVGGGYFRNRRTPTPAYESSGVGAIWKVRGQRWSEPTFLPKGRGGGANSLSLKWGWLF